MLLAFLIAVLAYTGPALASMELLSDCESASEGSAHAHATEVGAGSAIATEIADVATHSTDVTGEAVHCGIHSCAAVLDVAGAPAFGESLLDVARSKLSPPFVLDDRSSALHRPPNA